MTASTRRLACGLVAVFGSLLLLWFADPHADPGSQRILAADENLRWFKGNLHTHTLWSDGDDYPEQVALWYKERGYDFLAFTDHNTLLGREYWIDVEKNKAGRPALDKLRARFPGTWIEQRKKADGADEVRLKTFDEIVARLGEPGKFLLIQGEEITDKFGMLPIHMNATNVAEMIPPLGGESIYDVMQRNTDALIAQRERLRRPMLIHLNHPNFGYAITAEDLMRVRGENFFEVYNGHPSTFSLGDKQHASAERIWDIVLTRRLTELKLPIMYGLGTDDGHNYHEIPSRKSEPGRGWVMVLARELTPAALIEALEAGRFYASSGVRLKRVTSTPERVEVEVDADPGVEYVTEFIGTRRGFDPANEPVIGADGKTIGTTRRYSADIGRVLKTVPGTRASYDLSPDDLYVRARITSTRPHPNPAEVGEFERAWVQPVKGPAVSD